MSAAPRVVSWSEIAETLGRLDLMGEIEAGFVAYSRGEAVIPPVGELNLEDPPGDVHIKYGYLRSGDCYVVKIASGFHENTALGLATGNGLMLLFRQTTGELLAVLLDEGRLTDIRTAVAGAIAAKHLATKNLEQVGIVGTGTQARLQLDYLRRTQGIRRAVVWGRSAESLESYRRDMEAGGFEIETTTDMAALMESCRLIVTTTPTKEPLIDVSQVRPGTHITAVGSDTLEKQELDAEILARADVVVADSISQCRERGEISQALRAGVLQSSDVVELGAVIAGSASGREHDDQITIADLTGVAVQDLQIARAVLAELSPQG